MRDHRNIKPIPTDRSEWKARIQWVKNHKVWTHKATARMPPDGIDGIFGPPVGNLSEMLFDGPDWVDFTYDDGSIYERVHVEYVYVNPEREFIEEDDSLNTAFRVWLEGGPWHDQATDEHTPAPPEGWNEWNRWCGSHDIRLDCGAPTMEEALLKLASMVECFYNDDGSARGGGIWWCSWDDDEGCNPGDDGYCTKCGFAIEV